MRVMGYWKDRQIIEHEQGWSMTDHWICSDCLDEPVLKEAVDNATDADEECAFCGTSPAAPLDVVMELFAKGIRHLYDRTVAVLFWADDVTPTTSTDEIVWEFADVFKNNEALIEVVLDSMGYEEWVATDFVVPHPGDAMMYAWEQFCHAVKFQTRYVIWLRPPGPYDGEGGQVPVAQILNRVADVIEEFGLVKEHDAATLWWRAQPHDTTTIDHTPGRLGTVPVQLAQQPNRMSPAGIPMFYGAVNPTTAVAEVASPSVGAATNFVTYARFLTSRQTRVLDLTHLAPVPSIFDPHNWHLYDKLQFLHRFVSQLSSKATPDWEAVDYVPTQVLTEFFLRVYGQPDQPLDGIVYTSATTGDPCVVLDVTNQRCVHQDPGWPTATDAELLLGLDTASIQTQEMVPPPTV